MTGGIGGAERGSQDVSIWESEGTAAVSSHDLYENDSISKADPAVIKEILNSLELDAPKLYPKDETRLNSTKTKQTPDGNKAGTITMDNEFEQLTSAQMQSILKGDLKTMAQMEENGTLIEGFTEDYHNTAQNLYNTQFFKEMDGHPDLAALAEKYGLSAEEMQSRVAYEYMTQNPNMPSDIKELISGLDAKVISGLKEPISEIYSAESSDVSEVLSNWVSEPNTNGYMAALQNRFEDGVKDHIKANAKSPESAIRALNAYYGIENAKAGPEDIALAESAQKAVLENLQSEGVVGPDFTQTPGSNLQLASIEMNFAYVLQGIAADPSNPTASEIKAATAQIRGEYQLNSDWKPSQEAINAPSQMTTSGKAAFQSARHIEEMVQGMKEVVDRMADGPEKEGIMNFLKMITEALDGLKGLLFQMQLKDAGLGHKLTRMERDMNLHKINKEEAERKRIEAHNRKAKKKKGIMKVFAPLQKVMSIGGLIATLASGPLGLVVFAMAIASEIQGDGFENNLFSKGMDQLTEKCRGLGSGGRFLSIGVQLAVCTVAADHTSGGILEGNPAFLSESIVEDLVLGMGGSQKDVMIVDLTVKVSTMIVICALTMGAGGAGGAATAGASKGAAAAGKASARISKESLKKIAKVLYGLASINEGAAQIVQGLYHLENAKIAEIQGELDKFIEEIQALIKVLKKVLNNLFEALDGPAEFAKEVQGVLDNVFNQSQSQLNQITQA